MSRSRRKTPICGLSATRKSQHAWSKGEHRRERSAVKKALHCGLYDSLPHRKQFGNEWDSPRDGKTYFGSMPSLRWYWIWARQTIEEYIAEAIQERKKLMRK